MSKLFRPGLAHDDTTRTSFPVGLALLFFTALVGLICVAVLAVALATGALPDTIRVPLPDVTDWLQRLFASTTPPPSLGPGTGGDLPTSIAAAPKCAQDRAVVDAVHGVMNVLNGPLRLSLAVFGLLSGMAVAVLRTSPTPALLAMVSVAALFFGPAALLPLVAGC